MNDNTWICPQCQKENPSKSEFCGACGAPKETQKETPIVEKLTGCTCPSCGKENDAFAVFCSGCGAKMQKEAPSKKACRKCRLIYPTEDSFCKKCGAPLKPYVPKAKGEKKAKNATPIAFYDKIITLVMAVLMIVCAFLPCFCYETYGIIFTESYTARFNTFEMIQLRFDALAEEANEDLLDKSQTYKNYYYSENNKNRMERISVKLRTRYQMQLTKDGADSMITVGNVCIAYLCFVVLFLAYALFKFFYKKEKGIAVIILNVAMLLVTLVLLFVVFMKGMDDLYFHWERRGIYNVLMIVMIVSTFLVPLFRVGKGSLSGIQKLFSLIKKKCKKSEYTEY